MLDGRRKEKGEKKNDSGRKIGENEQKATVLIFSLRQIQNDVRFWCR